MNKKNIITILFTLIICLILVVCHLGDKVYEEVNTFYQVYLNGNVIGVIRDEDKLYKLIDDNQSNIKSEYNVTSVYPPTNLKIVKTNTYNKRIDNEEEVYKKIEDKDDFTIRGYKILVKKEDKEFTINVIDKNIFYDAAKRFVRAFLDEDEYEKYINNNQSEIVETGRIIENMDFAEDVTVKEDFISVKDKIYTDELELTQFLLFGENPDTKTYTVKLGDTIESVSNANQLNPEEFLTANTKYKDQNSLLRVGDTVNVTLINPQLTFVYDVFQISNEIDYFTADEVKDANKPEGFRETTVAGQNGVNRVTERFQVTNGEPEQEVEIISSEQIRETINQITVVGTKRTNIYVPQNPVNIGGSWGWPTNKGYVITSYFSYRWGTHHDGIDISGAGNYNSPIYAVADGVVEYVYSGCPGRGSGLGDTCGGSLGNHIIINHGNNIYIIYAHNASVNVSKGQRVTRGQRIANMGSSGRATGVHLHFSVSVGYPYASGSTFQDPLSLYR